MKQRQTRATGIQELTAFLVARFTHEELRYFLDRLPDGQELVARLPGKDTPLVDLVHEAVALLEREGRLDLAFFAALCEARARHTKEIRTLQTTILEPERRIHRGSIPICIVALQAELSAETAAVRHLLGRLGARSSEAVVVDPTAPDAAASLPRAALRVVLVGAGTGGQSGEALLRAALEGGENTVSARLASLDMAREDLFEADLSRSRPLRRRCTLVFSGPEDLPRVLEEPLLAWLDEHAPQADGPGAVLSPGERRYLQDHSARWEEGLHGPLRRVAGRAARNLTREQLYVSLHAESLEWRRGEEGRPVRVRRTERPTEEQKTTPLFLDELLCLPALPCVVVLGEAGCGKTVLLQHLAWCLALAHQGLPLSEEAHLDLAALQGDRDLLPIPVLFEARLLASGTGAVEAQVAGELGTEPAALAQGLAAGRYLLLVDSLDEVPGAEARQRVLQALAGFHRKSSCRVVLSSRPGAHTGAEPPKPFQRVQIAALDEDRRLALVTRWCNAQKLETAERTGVRAALATLAARVPGGEQGLSPLDNPLLLSCVLFVWLGERRLPENTADLYRKMVGLLIACKPEEGSSAGREGLLVATMGALQRAGSTALPLRKLAEILVDSARLGLRDQESAEAAVDALAAGTGLLRIEEQSPGRWVVRPWHRSFQEYLAAVALTQDARAVVEVTQGLAYVEPGQTTPPLFDPAWEGCLRFAVGAFGQGGQVRAQQYVETLVSLAEERPEPEREGRLLGLAAAGIAEYELEYFEQSELRARLPQLIAVRYAAAGQDWPWRDRVLALDALGRLGDPRLPDPRESGAGWVEIPAGVVRVGGDTEAYASLPEQDFEFQGFWMRQTPATVGEYAAFIEEGGYAQAAHWEGPKPDSSEPEEWGVQRRHPNRPVVGVNWWEARAFCRWATDRWKRPVGGGIIDLPTSREWEAAARGDRGGPYPWGPEEPGSANQARANHRWGKGTPDRVTPTGVFPAGHAGGLWDMAGNVWEWCATVWIDEKSERDDMVGDKDKVGLTIVNPWRVFHGGSWGDDSGGLRCARRDWDFSSLRLQRLGFRVVCRFAPSTER